MRRGGSIWKKDTYARANLKEGFRNDSLKHIQAYALNPGMCFIISKKISEIEVNP